MTPLNLAAFKQNRYFVKRLLEAGADTSIPDDEKFLPLHNVVNGDQEIVTLLLEHGSPTSYLNEPTSPLFIAVKNRQLRIAYQLIEKGADPDSAPISIAINNDDSIGLRLLLLSGASTDGVKDDDLKPEFRKMKKDWECKASTNDEIKIQKEVDNLSREKTELQKKLNDYAEESKKSSFLSEFLTPVVNGINEKVVNVARFVRNIESCYRHIQNARFDYLKKQFSYLEEVERDNLEKMFNDTETKWKDFFSRTLETLKNHYGQSHSMFPGNCYPDIVNFQSQLPSDKDLLFKQESQQTKPNIELARENRSHLLSLNYLLKRVRAICSDTHQMIINFSEHINDLLLNIEELLIKMDKLIINSQQMNYDFQKRQIMVPSPKVVQSFSEKRSQLDLDIAFIRLEKEKFKEMISNLLKLVRHCSS